MPIVQRTNLSQNTVLAVWKIDESREELFAALTGRISDSGKNLHDNIHWLASRVLLQTLFTEGKIALIKDALNKPSLFIDGKPYSVSITHSYDYAAVMVSTTQTVAIDLEKIDKRVIRVARKFISAEETFAQENLTTYYTIIWSAKETLYKYYSKKELDFLENLRIMPFVLETNPFMIEGIITKNQYSLNIPIEVEMFDGYVMTWGVSS